MLESRPLRMFHEVVRTGSYSAAAEALGYTQPAISQQMRTLERTVGTPLFTRSGRHMQLTEAGEVLARHVQSVLSGLDAAEQQVAAIKNLATGRIRVCAFPSASATIVAAAVTHLKATRPGIRVQLLEAEPPESLQLLHDGKCDITLAFSYDGMSEVEESGLSQIPLMDDEMVAVLPIDHPMSRRRRIELRELADEAWIAGCPRCRTTFVQSCAAAGFEPEIAFSTDDNLAMQSLVVAGVGVAVMPSLVLAFLRHPKLVARPLRPVTHRSVSAYTLKDFTQIPATATTLEALQTAVGTLRPAETGTRAKTTPEIG
ncbi:probable transcriptional regulator, LysR family (plasmid) [Rhodococcus jostii RHA1]|uniref:Probable transcriptional regulator, LysR family n=1 Tax=Rhodococcus jostii (strain RHA1) TaxID=101510 RepID=Q0RVR5_RHOJR|nr:LysR substrate-binding domain-containing protein [Rhodococcus jostii]ABH00621.1 probable transcriptional regulator, LysR family [Rhodococcus jostii RHA1]